MAMLTTQQAADTLNVHAETIRRLVKAGKIKAISLSNTKYSRIRIDEKELQAFMNGAEISHDLDPQGE
jgi:excisionase family DNA binding protein